MHTQQILSTILHLSFYIFLIAPEFSIAQVQWKHDEPSTTGALAWERYPVEGFGLPSSVKPGETITFYTSVMDLDTTNASTGQPYQIQIYRLPNQTNALWTSQNIAGHFYPFRAADGTPIYPGNTSKRPVDFKLGCRDYWAPTAVSFQIPDTFRSGLYYARLHHLSIPDTT